jgi:hypothetical protein
MGKKPKKIGVIDDVVVTVLNLSLDPGTPIYISETNIEHMKDEHPEDYEKYGDKIGDILSQPDLVCEHPKNGSIQYIKVFIDEETQEKVLVAVRSSASGILYARSLFVMSEGKIKAYEKRGAFKEYKKDK